MLRQFEVTDKTLPIELQLGRRFMDRFGQQGVPKVEKPARLTYPYYGIPQRNRLFLSINEGEVETVNIFYRAIEMVENEFVMKALINDLYIRYRCIKKGLMMSIPVARRPNESTRGKDFEHAIHIVYNEYLAARMHHSMTLRPELEMGERSFEIYNEDTVSKEGLPMRNGFINFLQDMRNFIGNTGNYKSNAEDFAIRHKYAIYFIMLMAEQLKANILEKALPEDATIPKVVGRITEPVQHIFDMLIDSKNRYFGHLTLEQKYKLIGFVGLFLYNHIKLGQSFQNDAIRIYDPNQKQGKPEDMDKRIRKEKRRPRHRLSTQLFQVGYFGREPQSQSKMLICAMIIENYFFDDFEINESFLEHKYFDTINRRLAANNQILKKQRRANGAHPAQQPAKAN